MTNNPWRFFLLIMLWLLGMLGFVMACGWVFNWFINLADKE